MTQAAFGINVGLKTPLDMWIGWIRAAGEGKKEWVDLLYHEDRPDLGEVDKISEQVFGPVPGAAEDCLVPWTNYNRMLSMWMWRAWRDGADLFAAHAADEPPIKLSLGAPPAKIIRPALSVAGGEMDVLFVPSDGKSFALARFLPAKDASPGGGEIRWKADAPEGMIGARVCLGSAKDGSVRRLAVTSQAEGKALLHFYDLGAGDKPMRARTAEAPGMFLVPRTDPGIRIEDDGSTVIEALVSKAPLAIGGGEVFVARARFKADGAPEGDARIGEKGVRLPLPPISGVFANQVVPAKVMRSHWAVLLPDGKILHSEHPDKPMPQRGIAVRPLELVACTQTTYVLVVHPAEGLIVDALK